MDGGRWAMDENNRLSSIVYRPLFFIW